ncbi:MAG: prepilin peptidase [Alphaproteobacteria bacterium]
MSASLAYLALGLFAVALVWAAAGDARRLLIPNRLVIGIVALYPVFVLAAPGNVAWLPAIGIGLAAFAIGALLFACGCAGGGDVKLLAAVALWAGPDLIAPLLIVTAFTGGLVAIAVSRPVRALIRRLSPHYAPRELPRDYRSGAAGPDQRACSLQGIAIACGGLFVAQRLTLFLST